MAQLITCELWEHVAQRFGLHPYGGDRQNMERQVSRMPTQESNELLAWLSSDDLGSRAKYKVWMQSEEIL